MMNGNYKSNGEEREVPKTDMKIKKNIAKRVAVATLVALSAISFCACQKPSTQPGNNIAVEQDATGGNGQKINEKEVVVGGGQTPTAPTQVQNTGDPIKDEASWPIGKFGYHEPPMELRNYNDPDHPDRYRIAIHSDIYGDLDLAYDGKKGTRVLFTAGGSARDQLMIISEDNPISIAEALQDLKMGDSIARNFGK